MTWEDDSQDDFKPSALYVLLYSIIGFFFLFVIEVRLIFSRVNRGVGSSEGKVAKDPPVIRKRVATERH